MNEPTIDDPEVRRSTIFSGQDGLRAGWSIALFFAILILFAVLLSPLANSSFFHDAAKHAAEQAAAGVIGPADALVSEGFQAVLVVLAAYLVSRVERRPFRQYGFAAGHGLHNAAQGALCGVAALSLLIALLWLTHSITFGGVLLAPGAALLYAMEWAVAMVFVGFFEEFLFRGFLQFTLARGIAGMVRAVRPESRHVQAIGFWIAAFLLSVCGFAATHLSNHGETLLGIGAVAVAGTVFVFSLWRTGSLWWAIGFHSAWDWAQSYLYGTPDSGTLSQGRLLASHAMGARWLSGGTDGPEGSVLVIPVLLGVGVVIHFALPKRGDAGVE